MALFQGCTAPSPEKWYSAESIPLCDDSQGKFLDFEKLKKYGKWYPYDTLQMEEGDSLLISFDFISDCCLTFTADARIESDTLFLQYRFANDSTGGCDCSCDYRILYKFDKEDKRWSTMNIVNMNGFKPEERNIQ